VPHVATAVPENLVLSEFFFFVTLTAVNAETVRGCCGVGSVRFLENFRDERVEAIGCEPLGGKICGETLLSKLLRPVHISSSSKVVSPSTRGASS